MSKVDIPKINVEPKTNIVCHNHTCLKNERFHVMEFLTELYLPNVQAEVNTTKL